MKKIVFFFLIFLTACASHIPDRPNDLCHMLRENPHWHKTALEVERRWNIPLETLFSVVYQESAFRSNAQPAFRWFLFIPLGRPSSAYGYAQALDQTWALYQQSSGNRWASRSRMSDSLDFMGWYMDQARKRNQVSGLDAYALYLNYHEGWGGYRNQTYLTKKWLMQVARKVQERANQYTKQYLECFGLRYE